MSVISSRRAWDWCQESVSGEIKAFKVTLPVYFQILSAIKGLGEQGVKEFAKRQASGFIAVDLPMSRIIVFEDGSIVSPLSVSATINGIKQMPRYC